ncbi:hypothetical protein ACLFLT_10130 [Klebsiella pneumoniae]
MTIHSTHNSQTRVAESGKFKKQLTLTDLTFIGLGAIFAPDWCQHVASIAGPAGIASWVIGGFAVLLLGIVLRAGGGAAAPAALFATRSFPRRADGLSTGVHHPDRFLQPDLD